MAAKLTGMPDWWTAYQFDLAIRHAGIWIDNKLNETETIGKKTVPKYKLSELIGDKPEQSTSEKIAASRAGKTLRRARK